MTVGKVQSAISHTLYVPRAQLEEWFARAKAGAQTMYARGPVLDVGNEVRDMVADWIATGEVDAFKQRDAGSGDLMHCIRRCRRQAVTTKVQRVSVDDAFRDSVAGKIFLAVVRAANMGLPCPSNAELAKAGGLNDADQGRYQLYELAKAGRLLIDSGAGRTDRRAKVVETGRWTAKVSEQRKF